MTRKRVPAPEPLSRRLDVLSVLGVDVTPGTEVVLSETPGRRAGRYQIRVIELDPSGTPLLSVMGPLSGTSDPHWRYVRPESVTRVLRKK